MIYLLAVLYGVVVMCALFGLQQLLWLMHFKHKDIEPEAEAEPLSYYRIAELERDIWGQTFHTAFTDCACDTCTGRKPVYTNRDLVRPPIKHAGPIVGKLARAVADWQRGRSQAYIISQYGKGISDTIRAMTGSEPWRDREGE